MTENSFRFRVLESQGQAYNHLDTAPVIAMKDIQIAASNIRSEYVPRDPYQASVYKEKIEEAIRYFTKVKDDEFFVDTEFTYLLQEIGITRDPLTNRPSSNIAGVARAVWKKNKRYRHVIDPKIESTKHLLMKEVERKDQHDDDYLLYVQQLALFSQRIIQRAVDTALSNFSDEEVKENPLVEDE